MAQSIWAGTRTLHGAQEWVYGTITPGGSSAALLQGQAGQTRYVRFEYTDTGEVHDFVMVVGSLAPSYWGFGVGISGDSLTPSTFTRVGVVYTVIEVFYNASIGSVVSVTGSTTATNIPNRVTISDVPFGPPPPVTHAPNVPIDLTLNAGDGNLDASWLAPMVSPAFGPAATYDVRYRVLNTVPWTTLTGILPTAASILNLMNGTAYEVQVRAVNAIGESAWTDTVTGTPRIRITNYLDMHLWEAQRYRLTHNRQLNFHTGSYFTSTNNHHLDGVPFYIRTGDIENPSTNDPSTYLGLGSIGITYNYFPARWNNHLGVALDIAGHQFVYDSNVPNMSIVLFQALVARMCFAAPNAAGTGSAVAGRFVTVGPIAFTEQIADWMQAFGSISPNDTTHLYVDLVTIAGRQTPAAPDIPTDLQLAAIGNTLDVSWVAPVAVEPDPAAVPPIVGFGAADTYDIRYRVVGAPDWIIRTGITMTNADITNLLYATLYEVQVRAVNEVEESDWTASATATTGPFPSNSTLFSQFTLFIDRAGSFTDEFPNVLQFFAKWGRSEASYLARAQPVQMQVILENESGRYDPGAILPRGRIHLDHQGVTIAHAYVRSVRPQIDHSAGLRQTVIHAEGALALFNNDAHELSLFITDTVRTGSVVHEILNQTGWAPGARDIDAGQVRLQPAHYTEILAPRALGKAGPALRATETAEIGLLHERRGDFIVFEERFHRELDAAPPGFTFGSLAGAAFISPLGVTNPEDSWDNLYTAIRIGASRAVVQTDKRVYTWRKDTIDTDPLVIRAGTTVQFGIDMVIEPQNLENDNVKSVAQWTTVDSEFQNAAGVVVTTGVALTFLNDGRTRRRVNIVNANAFDVNLTKLELSGRGVALYGDLTIPYLEDAAAVALYDTRILDLETSFIGDGLNEGGDGVAEGNATAQLLLTRYAHPQPHGRQAFDPLESTINLAAMHFMEISQPVNVLLGTGFQAGIYHVEGGDIQLDVGREWAEMGVNLSRRGLRFIARNDAVNVTPPDTTWVNITAPFTLLVGQPYVIAAEVTFPTGAVLSTSDDPVMRVLLNGQQYSVWSETDIPINDPQFRAALVLGPGVVLVQVRLRAAGGNPITASHVRYVRIDS